MANRDLTLWQRSDFLAPSPGPAYGYSDWMGYGVGGTLHGYGDGSGYAMTASVADMLQESFSPEVRIWKTKV